uniref:LysR substrate-binding domain-containing protein n=1 Tax=Streptomyces hirsutus TaxID=35620 RepID=UPI0006E33BFA
AQDDLLAAAGRTRPLLVDLNSPGLATGRRVLYRARELSPGHELMARYESGLTWAAGELVAGRLDASFGRFAGLPAVLKAGLDQQPVRYEPMAVILPEGHPLAALAEVPLDALAGEEVYAGAGNPRTPEWTDLAELLFEGRGIDVASPAPLAVGDEEFQRIMARTGNPVLAVVDFPPLPSMVLRPLVDPVPLSPVSLVWRKGLIHPALDALRRAATEVAAKDGWLRVPAGGWAPAVDRDLWSAGAGP